MAELALDHIGLTVGDAIILDDISVKLTTNEFVAIVGPNGAGKTSLLQCALGLTPPTTGAALINGAPVSSLVPTERARLISYLPQIRPLVWPITVRDVVALGRYAFGASISKPKGADAEAVDKALRDCNLKHLTDRHTDTLSGGELARVHCARSFAAEAPLLIADEPVAALDPKHQFQIMRLIRQFVDNGGGALAVLHNIDLAARFADRFVWLKDGKLVADGAVRETLTPERMKSVFDVDARISFDGAAPAVTLHDAVGGD